MTSGDTDIFQRKGAKSLRTQSIVVKDSDEKTVINQINLRDTSEAN